MQEKSLEQRKIKLLFFLIGAGILILFLRNLFPDRSEIALLTIKEYGVQIMFIFPAVLLLMGLAEVWVPQERIKKYLGEESGIRGGLLSLFLGTLPTGPLFIAFPIAGEMLRKGASIVNIVIFLGAYSALKLPELAIEIHFLGIEFTIYRFILTFIAVILIGVLTAKIINHKGGVVK